MEMNYLSISLQIIVAMSIINVWLINYNQESRWRGGNAENLSAEFRAYGLPDWSLYVVGTLKVLLALLLLLGIWYPFLRRPSAFCLALFLAGSVVMHFRIRDPWTRSLPAFFLFLLCLGIVYLTYV